ncbi:MAG: hypothetical protein FD123_3629 [Bacteroidetes bacterium]|nr:MAG: hypothetical protein FD123_3629 [Bacteroidota bacterium]
MAGVILLLPAFHLSAQPVDNPKDPFSFIGGAEVFVHTDLKMALKDPERVYKLDLTGQVFEPKQLAKVPKLVNVQAIRLGENGFKTLPAVFTGLPSLIYFSSKNNALDSLPRDFSLLRELRYVELVGTDFDTFPKPLTFLGRLKSLQIQNNKADTMHMISDIRFFAASLEELIMYKTKIDTLPKSFGDLKKLKTCYMIDCGITSLPATIGNLTALETLVLDNNGLTALPKEIGRMKNLGYLSLQNNKLTQVDERICFLQNLAILDLRGNSISDYDAAVLKVLLPGCTIYYK